MDVLPIEIRQGDRTLLHANTNLLVNSTFALGIISARALLEFLGLKAGKITNELKGRERKQDDDIVIEDFYGVDGSRLNMIDVATIEVEFPEHHEYVRRALWELISDAHKGTAHLTDLRKEDPDTFQIYRYGIKGLSILMDKYFYSEIGMACPGPYVFKEPTSQRVQDEDAPRSDHPRHSENNGRHI